VKTKLRIIAATHRNMAELVRSGKFREDLFYRLNVVPMHIPPLRERTEDIPALIQHFVSQAGAAKVFEPAAMKLMQQHRWTGNIRELENFTRRLVALCPQDIIGAETVSAELSRLSPGMASSHSRAEIISMLMQDYFAALPAGEIYEPLINEIEKPLIERVLKITKGNQIKAAELLGLNRNTLRKKIRELGVEVRKA
jgi:two-component system nitrogen regulation response regulator GlnG